MNDKKFFVLFSCCVIVKGAVRSTICDTQRDAFEFIPNDLYDLLRNYKDKTLDEIKSAFGNQYNDTIDDYFEFLITNEYGFWHSQPNCFPEVSSDYVTPSIITNAVLDYDDKSEYNFASIFTQLDSLGCKDIQIRFFCSIEYKIIHLMLIEVEKTRIRSIDIIVKDSDSQTADDAVTLIKAISQITSITIHSSKTNELVFNGYEGAKRVMRTMQVIDNASHCGIISPVYFSININTINEGTSHNTCLNKKLSIDTRGNIKNCPSLSAHFGNVSDTTLSASVEHTGFRALWNITKDQINICKDCEFRVICTDCRAFIQNSNDTYSKPSKCSYNPYTTIWE